MADDLGAHTSEVHRARDAILGFWFDELTPEQHWQKDAKLDAGIAERFGAIRDAIFASDAALWRGDPDTLLAAVIALDQFSRNIHRGDARAFEADPLALSLAREAIAEGWDQRLAAERRTFLYLPFEHSEERPVQDESVRLFEALGNAEQLEFARGHRDLIERFGRFPHRNAALGRRSTPVEEEYLSQPGAGY